MKLKYIILSSCILIYACNGSQKKSKDTNHNPLSFEVPLYMPQYQSTDIQHPSSETSYKVPEKVEPARVEPIESVFSARIIKKVMMRGTKMARMMLSA